MSISKIRAVTSVYWDMEDFPVPEGRCVKSFKENITKVVRDLGYCGSIWNLNGYRSYDNKMSMEVDESSGIYLYENRKTKFERLMNILTRMLSFARGHVTEPMLEYNFILIAKDAPDGDNEFVTAIDTLMKFGCNVYLAVPDGLPLAEMPPITMASRVWYWSDLFDGKSPVQRIGGEPDGPWEKKIKNHVSSSDYELRDGDDTTSDLSDSSSSSSDDEDEDEDEDEDDGFPNKREKKDMPDEEELMSEF